MSLVRQEPQFEVVVASLEQKPIVANLLELYVHDFSEFVECAIGQDGRFGYKNLDCYWTDPRRYPFLIYVNGGLAGFFFMQGISSGGGTLWDMVEFFVLRGYRGRSIGTRVAHEAFARYPGTWQVRVMESNAPAFAFWNRTVRAFAGENVALDQIVVEDRRWNRFLFVSPPVD